MKKLLQINEDFLFLESYLKELPMIFESLDGLIFKKRNTIKVQTIAGIKVVIKSYEKIYLANRLIYRFLRDSKGKRAFDYSCYFLRHKVNTPVPIAYIDCHSRWFYRSGYYICEFSDFQTLEHFGDKDRGEKVAMLSDLANFIADLHRKRIYHLDFSLSNILFKKIDGSYQFSLVDNNRVRITDISPRTGVKGLRRLGFPAPDMAYLIEQYALQRGLNESRGLKLFFTYKYEQDLKYNRKMWLKKIRNHLSGLFKTPVSS